MILRPSQISTLALALCALVFPFRISPAQTPPATVHGSGIKDWKPFIGEYDCMHFAMIGVGQFGTISSGINLSILSSNSYQATMNGTKPPAAFTFSDMSPGPGGKGLYGTITFTSGLLAGRRALVQDHDQFKYAIIFPGAWKMADGKTDALSPGDTWCYFHKK